jgi:UTP-glucose-1-phosphate uridylyltransferase
MVLAAGLGTRLAPITHTTPKPLVPVAGRPLLEHLLEFLRAGGIEEVVINLHHLGAKIQAHVGDGARFGLHVVYSAEDPILDTGGGIKKAEPLLAGEPFVVANGDSLLEVRLRCVRIRTRLVTAQWSSMTRTASAASSACRPVRSRGRARSCSRGSTSSSRASSAGWMRAASSASRG